MDSRHRRDSLKMSFHYQPPGAVLLCAAEPKLPKRSGSIDSGYAPSVPACGESSAEGLCDVCPEAAVKACLTCRDSYCETHAKEHYTNPDLMRHQLHHIQHQSLQRTQSKSTIRQAVPPPGPLQFHSVTPDSVTVVWSPPEGALGNHKYRVTRRGEQEQRVIKVAGLSLTVTDLIPGETYHFSVATLSEDGYQSTCVEGTVHTEVPPPENVSVDLKLFTAFVSWTKPALVEQVSYLLELFRDEKCIDTVNRNSLNHTFTDLQPAQNYIIHVTTVLNNGKHQSKPVSKPFKTVIPVPERLTESSMAAFSAHLSWQVSPELKQTAHSFLVSYKCKGTQPKSFSTQSCSADITGLRPATEYSVRVCTQLQQGGKSQPACIQMITENQVAVAVELCRGDKESFGFKLASQNNPAAGGFPHKVGSIVQGSPAERCGQLEVGNYISAVNGRSIMKLSHSDAVQLIRHAGKRLTLTVLL